MCNYSIGDVIWVLVPFADGSGIKTRPAIIIDIRDSPCKYFVVECSSFKEKHRSIPGIRISTTDPRFTECGFDEETFITQNKCWLKETMLKPHPTRGANPIGKCSFVDEVLRMLK